VRRLIAVAVGVALLAAGCTSTEEPEGPIEVQWREVTPPLPPGASGRVAVRDATFCAGRWWVVGAVYDGAQNTKPAAWTSLDGNTWTHVSFAPQTYWGERNILSSVACHDDRLAMIGAKSGGAHGNPRTSTWYQRPDGSMIEVIAGFSLYGGPEAVNVGRIASGDTGWMIVGNRVSGASVWVSPDATEFTLIDKDPQLGSDPGVDTAARDLSFTSGKWTVVGSGTIPGRLPRVPMAWESDDGKAWSRQAVPPGAEYEDMQRVVPYRDGLLSVGLRGEAYGVWHRASGAGWEPGETFGVQDPDRRAGPSVAGLTTAGDGLVATISDGSRYGLWASPDGRRWRSVTTPTRPTTGGEHTMTAVASARSVLLLADDAQVGKVWLVDTMPTG
jgi:hypothetical protein